ncbi:hypothetical protein L2Y96_07380 [Luteibacter aegosomaticola]|uniref:hypothetical protein n=1 Tax=Luteibacter aegosomaticola TaxID=2911538 RepID=UPI001FF720C2|nr:hypothetical protein [Luteibacter aegosomaticola]UPG91584.1 hypothetical protein L2Y96_07380 [Luteibacter aegosomaticola]
MKPTLRNRLVAIALLTAPAWAFAQVANPYAKPTAAASAPQDKGTKMDDLKSFATGGAKVLESIKGDLTGDGRQGAVLIIDPPGGANAKLGEGPARDVLLVVPDASGHLQKVASNARIVPCVTCGGIAGDPYGYTRVGKGEFTIVNGGGSRERWSDEFTFTWSAAKKDWLASHVVRKVSDDESGKEKQVDLSAKDLGGVTFKDFDPSHLPEATLP